MEYRRLGESDVKISTIAFGAWAIGGWMWGGADEKDAISALETAIDNGMTSIDTAPAYGFGQSEEIVGKILKGKRDKVQILTKYGLRWDLKKGNFYFSTKANDGSDLDLYKYAGKESVIYECEQSLKRLKTDYIDLYQIHWPDESTPFNETMEALEKLIKEGKVRAVGVCNFSVEQMIDADNYGVIVSNQVPYSMVKREIENELVPYCIENKKAILAYSPLQRGLLTGKIKPGHQFNEGDGRPATPYFKEPNLSRINAMLDNIKPIADQHSASLTHLVLSWTLHQPGITCALAGARNAEQVKDNLKAVDIQLSGEEIITINNELENLKLEF